MLLKRLLELWPPQDPFQFRKKRQRADQPNPSGDGGINELSRNSSPDQTREGRVGVKNQPQVASPCGMHGSPR
jgi:hypothetical protein